TRSRIKPRHAQPIDRTILADQCGRLQVANQGIILDSQRHDGLANSTPVGRSFCNVEDTENAEKVAQSVASGLPWLVAIMRICRLAPSLRWWNIFGIVD